MRELIRTAQPKAKVLPGYPRRALDLLVNVLHTLGVAPGSDPNEGRNKRKRSE